MAGVQELRDFLDRSPSPWHAVATAAARLDAAGATAVSLDDAWGDVPAFGYVVDGGALIAWRLPAATPAPLRIVGAHTDSPGLRLHPDPAQQTVANWQLLGVEIYGGVLLNSWLDRDLGVAGRVTGADGTTVLIDVAEPIARVPQLAIHLDRNVNDGLTLDRHQHLRPVWALDESIDPTAWLSARAGIAASDWDLCFYDVQPAAVLGADRSLLASGRLDNLLSCWAAIEALGAATPDGAIAVAALFDHEEVGSSSTTGASGPLLATVVERLLHAVGADDIDSRARLLHASSCVSADNAHAIHPNYPERHDSGHAPLINHGPAIKINANQRYATTPETAALFARCCATAGVPVQRFVSRNNVPCGSTIGPLTATRLGIATVDVGVPQLSMHSARELCGAADPDHLRAALGVYLSGAD